MKLKNFLPVFLSGMLLLSLFASNKSVPTFSREKDIRLPILMYHSVLKDTSRTNKYTITPSKFEEDILYLKENGYTPVFAKQLIQFVYSDIPLPQKPVLITFDDGMYNNFEYVFPILKKHNVPAVFSVVGSYTDEYSQSNIVAPAYSYLRWQDINELANSHLVEFASHSYSFHTITNKRYGTTKNKDETSSEYISVFYEDTEKLQSAFFSNCSFKPVIYTYPFGSYSTESTNVLQKMGFLMSFSCTEGINKISDDPKCLYLLKRYNRDGRKSTKEFFSKIKL